jgi:energy-coupling factor transporter transmembrane protein EcfT
LLNDNEQLSALLKGMPLNRAMRSIVLGIFALIMSFCGFLALSDWMRQFSSVYAVIMLIGAVLFTTCVIPHHVICGLVEWLYIKLGRTNEARKVVLEFFKKTSATMIVCYIGLLIFSVTFFKAVLTGTTTLPKWACIFNTLPLFILLSPFKLAGSGNIANALMFLALAVLI